MNAQVAIVKCPTYKQEQLDKAIDQILKYLGGLEKFIKPDEKVLIKPNLLSAREPHEGVDTHAELIRAVVRRVKSISTNIKIGDSPGGFGKNIEEVYEKSGVRKISEEERVELVKFDKSKRIGRYPIASLVLEADKIISLPKFKTHDVMLITAAVKNMYGIIPGIFKAELHSLAPRRKDFAPIIVDVFSIRKPDLTIMDAIVSMDGEGPSRGRLRKTNFIIASADAVAVDSVLMKIIDREPFDLYTNIEAHKRTLGITDLENIEILGEAIDSVKVDNFKFSNIGFLNNAPGPLLWLAKLLINFKIEIDNGQCLRCKLCQESCPVDAITIDDDECKVDNSKCLLCLCCREICPHGAVVVNRSWLARMIWG